MRLLRSLSLVLAAAGGPIAAGAQLASPSCQITAVPAQIRSEGVTERLGDIVIHCTGTPGREIIGNLTVSISTAVTNRVLTGNTLDVSLTVNNGSGEAPANVPATLAANNQITFSGLRFTIGPSGSVALRLSNLRGDASFAGLGGARIVTQLAFSGGLLNFTNTAFEIGVPQRGLYATTLTTVIPNQLGSPLPDPIGFDELIRRGTLFASTRVTEGFVAAFEPRQPQTDSGTRILLRFSGYPADARLFVPASIAGSNAEIPTRAGDFGGVVSGGRHVSGSGTLLLTRVLNTDPNGGGGMPVTGFFGDAGTFNAMTEVQLTNGSGIAVYEVMDANPTARESAQIPVFIGLARAQSQRNVTMGLQVSFAPLSTTSNAVAFAPVPRFAGAAAPTDCSLFNDCEQYIPRLEAPPVNTSFTLVRGVGVEQRLIPLSNLGGGLMPWSATVEYRNGSNWVRIDPTSGLQPLLIRMIVTARSEMAPGLYEAALIIDAGPAGVARYPLSLRVIDPPPPATPKPVLTSVVHGATFETGPVAPGSFLTLRGSNLTGPSVVVTIGGRNARVVYSSSDQINVQVPDELPSNTVQVVVSVSGVASDPLTVNVAAVNPGIFSPGILNQDGSLNSASNPAHTGSFVQVFATGLLPPSGEGTVDVTIHALAAPDVAYAGPAPGIPGLQQVNVRVPAGYPTMMTYIAVCTRAGGARVCSPERPIYIRNVE